MTSAHLLPSDWMMRLERLTLGSGRRVAGTLQGKRRSSRLGSSLEFADYRSYAPGDDIRRFDWGVYSRTGKPFVRQFMDEQELMLSLYVDCSASMDFGGSQAMKGMMTGKAGDNKLLFAKRLAASIGYIALCSYERVGALCYSNRLNGRLPVLRGRGSANRLFQFLQDMPPGGEGSLASALGEPGAMPRLSGMTWIFSDFWLREGESEMGNILSRLVGAGQEVVLVQVLSPEEIHPELSGDLRLIDSELNTGKEVAITGRVLHRYTEELEHYQNELRKTASERGTSFVTLSSDMTLQEAVFGVFANAGLIRV
ncbi:DUF58 domain-containing protein [Paenibacillus sp.]|jgi:uncharacterized protein (DUF58 family)|uniref:DUF58 domain-containing protein n=1 Tax=Paenibacillus sp. TaxID=58172 RepID=UPI0028178F4D|nr:DUF58 domain-containing protein [Paenibacillus sp.]MDR0269829.1 DUF58 domain-containing protein [Paenibacillus sp.]